MFWLYVQQKAFTIIILRKFILSHHLVMTIRAKWTRLDIYKPLKPELKYCSWIPYLKMFRIAAVLSFVSLCLCSNPVYEGKHFKAYKLEEMASTRVKSQEFQETTRNGLRSFIEIPYNGSVPEDYGTPLFGDMEFTLTRKDGELLFRDTIVNQNYYENIIIEYNRTFPGYYIEDLRIFNVGRQRGFTTYGGIYHNSGYVETEILIAAYNTVRIFVEIYVRSY